MKRTIISTFIIAISGGTALASDFVDNAQVISSTPIVQRISEPRQVCSDQTVVTPAQPASQGSGVVGGILGGLAGGLLGAQVGHGSGKTAATIAGAAGGAILGNNIGSSSQPATAQQVQTCNTVQSTRDVVTGYAVVYRYNGRDVTTTLPYNPGSYVKVGVGVVDEGVAVINTPHRHRDAYGQMPPPPPPPAGYSSSTPPGYSSPPPSYSPPPPGSYQ